MNFMTASIVVDVNFTKAASELKKSEVAAKRRLKEREKIEKYVARSTIKEAKRAAKATEKAATVAARAAVKAHKLMVRRIKKAYRTVTRTVKNAFSVMTKTAKWAGAALVGILGLSARAAMKQEDALFLLNAALKISGEYTRELEQDFVNFAAEIQRTTIYGDEFVLSLMQQQKSLGVTADKLKDGAKMAVGLATATGLGIESMSRYVALAFQGEFTMLRRYIPALRATTDATEQLAIVTKFASDGFKLAEERSKTTSGGLRQLWNVIGDVTEKIGMAFLPMIRRASDTIKQWATDNQERIAVIAEVWAKKLEAITNKVWDFFKILTTDFSKGMGIIKTIVIEALVALVNSFLIAGIAAGKAFWRGIGLGKPSRNEVMKQFWQEQEAGAGHSFGLTGPDPEVYARIERELMIEQLRDEVGVVSQLAAVWERAGDAMADAIPARVQQPEGVPLIGAHEAYAKSLDPVVAAEEQAQALMEIDDELFEHQVANANKLTEMKITNDEKARDAMKVSAEEHIDFVRSNNWLTVDEKIQAVELEMERKREAWGEESEAMALLDEERRKYEANNIKGWEKINQNIQLYIKNLGNWADELTSIMGSAFKSMADNFADMLMQEEVDWKTFAKSYLKQILSMIIQTYILAAIKAAITKDYSYLNAGAAGQQAAGQYSATGSYATGGYVRETGLALVHQGEYVNTRSNVTSGGGIGGMTVNITNNANVDVEQEYNQDERTLNVVINALTTNGPMRRAVSSVRR